MNPLCLLPSKGERDRTRHVKKDKFRLKSHAQTGFCPLPITNTQPISFVTFASFCSNSFRSASVALNPLCLLPSKGERDRTRHVKKGKFRLAAHAQTGFCPLPITNTQPISFVTFASFCSNFLRSASVAMNPLCLLPSKGERNRIRHVKKGKFRLTAHAQTGFCPLPITNTQPISFVTFASFCSNFLRSASVALNPLCLLPSKGERDRTRHVKKGKFRLTAHAQTGFCPLPITNPNLNLLCYLCFLLFKFFSFRFCPP
jgi:hypothetical protein